MEVRLFGPCSIWRIFRGKLNLPRALQKLFHVEHCPRRRPGPGHRTGISTLVSGEGDGGKVAAVIRLAAMRGATVGEEAGSVGIGAEAEIVDFAERGRPQ